MFPTDGFRHGDWGSQKYTGGVHCAEPLPVLKLDEAEAPPAWLRNMGPLATTPSTSDLPDGNRTRDVGIAAPADLEDRIAVTRVTV